MMYQRRGQRPYFSHDISVVVLLLNILIMLSVYYIPITSAFTLQNRYQHNSVHHHNSLLQQHHYPSRRYHQHHYNSISRTILSTSSNDDDINDEEEEEQLPPIIDGYNLFDDDDTNSLQSKEELQLMTINQLKQQLRLRGKKITGNKNDLIKRLLDNSVVDATIIVDSDSGSGGDNDRMTNGYTKYEKSYATLKRNSLLDIDDEDDVDEDEEESNDTSTTKQKKEKKNVESKRVAEAKSRGGDIVDVTDYINPMEVGKSFKSSDATSTTTTTSATSSQDIDYKEVNDEFSIDVDIINTTSSKSTSSTKSTASSSKDDGTSSEASNPEVWGEDARIIKDYEGKAIVVDGLSRTIIEYKGCNDILVQAYVVGSRMAMSNFLKGGTSQSADDDDDGEGEGDNSRETNKYKSMEEEVYAIQSKRELESKRGLTQTMLDNDDFETGQEDPTDEQSKDLYSTVERDYGDWGVYTPTGAQLSSTEVQGVLLLSDVYGAFTDSAQTLADKIAFECQPVVVIVPDMFRGDPWSEDRVNDSDDVDRQTLYEEWRAKHPESRVDIDIRAAASVLRERYAVSSIAVWGTCYGGGRALEAAAGWYPGCTSTSYYEEMNSSQSKPPPPHVDPVAAIAWYPTRYNTKQLFGKENEGYRTFHNGNDRKVAIMAVFAGNDVLPGAMPDDANLLQECLENDPRVVDYMVKIFPNQEHGFAHNHLGIEKTNEATSEEVNDDTQDDRFLGEDFGSSIEPLEMGGDAEVACLLSTAWMETYTRVFLPTVGTPVRYDENEEWSSTIEMNKRTEQGGDIRSEIDEAIFKFDDVEVDIGRMSQSASPLLEDGPGIEKYEQIEEERERIRQEILEKYGITEDDDEETFDLKFQQAQADGALDGLLLDAYLDDSGDAYW